MILTYLKQKGISLPPVESADGITVQDMINRMRGFLKRLYESHCDIVDFASDFMELLLEYPKSMCDYNMGDTLQLIATIIYFEGQPSPEDYEQYEKKAKEMKQDYGSLFKESYLPDRPEADFSYEHLSVMFNRSKATIHEAIRKKETQAKQLVAEARLRQKAKGMALDQLVHEEKEKLKLEQNSPESSQTNEQTVP